MNSNLAKAIYHFGAKYRNPSLRDEHDRLKESEWMSSSQLNDLQIERAKKIFAFTEKHSEYYKKIFKSINFTASSFNSIADLEKIPKITKTQLISNNKAIHTAYDFGKIFIAETSGTTGSALEFTKNERWDSINRANMMRAYDWYDVKPWDKYGYFWGYDIPQRQAIKVK